MGLENDIIKGQLKNVVLPSIRSNGSPIGRKEYHKIVKELIRELRRLEKDGK